MGLTLSPVALPSAIGALLMSGLVVFIVARRWSRTALPFALLCVAAAVWCMGHALEFSSPAVEGRVFWSKVQYFGSQAVPVLWFVFATIYSGHAYWLRWWKIAAIAVVPTLTILGVVTYPASQLVWVSFGVVANGEFLESAVVRGPLFWIAAVYGYTFVMAGIAMIALVAFRSSAVYRRQAVILLFGAVVPLISNMAFVLGARPLRMDSTPLSFALACLIFSFGLFRYRLFDLKPIAREAVLDSMSDAVVVIDGQGRMLDANPAALRLLRSPLSDLLGAPAAQHLPFWPAVLRLLGDPAAAPETIVDGRRGQAHELRVGRISGKNQELAGAIITLRNVSDRWQAEQALQRAYDELSKQVSELERRNEEMTLLSGLAEQLLSAVDQEALVEVVATIAPQLFPNESGLLALRERDRFRVAAAWGAGPRVGESLADGYGGTPWLPTPNQIAIPLVDQEERIGLFAIEASPGARHPQALRQLTTTAADLIGFALANLRLRDRLREESVRDVLTGLYNRRFLDEAIEREFRRAIRSGGALAVVMLDIDHFKVFNDRYGHAAGDSALRTLGRFLLARLRATDIACRYGGEEFTLLLPDTPLDHASRIAERLREEFQTIPMVHAGATYPPLTLSLGLAVSPEDGQSAPALLAAADAALYAAKAGGRNRVVFSGPPPAPPPSFRRQLPAAS
jgi:diguanylate cyclase (GGDEF)-like protein